MNGDTAEFVAVLAVLEQIDERLAHLEAAVPELERPVLPMLADMAARLERLEAKFDEYEPLIEMVRARAERGTWRKRNPGGIAT